MEQRRDGAGRPGRKQMATWDARGLPPVAAERIARAQASDVATSLLSVPAAASLESVGLDAVGEVMGCVVEHIGFQGYAGCGVTFGSWGGFAVAPPTSVGTRQSRWGAFRPYADAVRRGYATALARLLLEADGLAADGVVGIRLTMSNLDGAREFLALGTAVRARSRVRPAAPFTTDLPGTDVAKLMQAGWVPARLVVSFDMAIRHDDWQTMSQASSWGNAEVTGYTELTQHVRDLVRDDVHHQVRSLGADGFVASSIGLTVHSIEPAENHRDHVAEALMTGTALAEFARPRRGPRTPSLTVLPVGPMPSSRSSSTRSRP
jgi:uncharacterized protein YbjQ (UPF0145 family)